MIKTTLRPTCWGRWGKTYPKLCLYRDVRNIKKTGKKDAEVLMGEGRVGGWCAALQLHTKPSNEASKT